MRSTSRTSPCVGRAIPAGSPAKAGEDDVPILYLKDIDRHYVQGDATLEILKGAELAVWAGQSVALVAPSGSELQLTHVGVNPTRAGFLDALAMFGARLKFDLAQEGGPEPVAKLSVSAQKLRGAELDGGLVLRAIDEVPILAVLGAVAEGQTVIRGAGELRVKESDRLAQMATGLRAMGAWVEELPDGLKIEGRGGKLDGGASVDSAHDHRIALALSVAALVSHKPTVISGIEWADVSFPGFFRLLRRLGAEVEILP